MDITASDNSKRCIRTADNKLYVFLEESDSTLRVIRLNIVAQQEFRSCLLK